jgi:hypothetical protein
VRGQGSVGELAALAQTRAPGGSYPTLDEVFLALT